MAIRAFWRARFLSRTECGFARWHRAPCATDTRTEPSAVRLNWWGRHNKHSKRRHLVRGRREPYPTARLYARPPLPSRSVNQGAAPLCRLLLMLADVIVVRHRTVEASRRSIVQPFRSLQNGAQDGN